MLSMRRFAVTRSHETRHCWLVAVLLTLTTLCAGSDAAATPTGGAQTRMPGHVLPALADAIRQPQSWRKWLTGSDDTDAAQLNLTVVLRHDDETGFQNYLREVYDPASPAFRRFLTPTQIAQRFGPSQQAYDDTLSWLRAQDLELVQDSVNRMTLTLRGTRAAAAKTFAVNIDDYTLGERSFYANDTDPALPAELATHVQYIGGLSNLAVPRTPQPQRAVRLIFGTAVCYPWALLSGAAFQAGAGTGSSYNYYNAFITCFKNLEGKGPYDFLNGSDPPPPAWQDADGTGQTIGLVEFDAYAPSDIADYIALIGLPAGKISDVSRVDVAGGVAAPGAGQDEVLLDIDTVLTLAPGAKIRVYDAPFSGNTSFQTMFNAMIGNGVDVISNSWAYCEDQTTLADAQSVDSVLQTAAAAGISVFNGSGDKGSTCLDGAAGTIGVPADSPHATAVGGTSLVQGPGHTYGSETWWNGSADQPPSGQGGFGVSRYFARPSYQDGFTTSATRSIPDVASNADPAHGVVICNASEGGCPTGALNGGTSFSAPTWAAFTALLNQTQGSDLGALNAQLYALSASGAFHDAASMGSDFAHVGLGSPKLGLLHQKLTAQTTGAVDASVSVVWAFGNDNLAAFPTSSNGLVLSDDGVTTGYIVVKLADAMGNAVPGKTVTLTGNPGNHATISPASMVTDSVGTAVFTVTDLTAEPLTLTAADTSDGITLTQTAQFDFAVAPAASAGITASPNTVNADGSSTTTITVTLQDALSRPTPGKFIALAQTGNSVISGPTPSVTGTNGQIVFTATDDNNETVTYTAVDVTDGNVPVPGSAAVTFSNAASSDCNSAPPVAAAGYSVSTFSSGFAASDFFYSNVNFGGCPGAGNPTFVGSGILVADFYNGNLYSLGLNGGPVSSSNVLSSPGQSIGNLVLGLDGNLYATRFVTGGGFYSGEVVQIDPSTGAIARTLATGQTCPNGLAVDPLSGDLFFDDQCFGGGSDNPSVWRLSNLSNATPTQTVYASLPGSGGQQQLAFAPNGTLYAVSGGSGSNPAIVRISGTNTATPGTVTPLNITVDCCGLAIGKTLPDGDAQTLLVHKNNSLETIDITVTPATVDTVLATGNIAVGSVGRDGCLYSGTNHVVYKIANSASACTNTPTSPGAMPTLALSPVTVSPNPAQGSTQTFTATLSDLVAPAGTPVYFIVTGVNTQTQLVGIDGSGGSALSYKAIKSGADNVVASITVNGTTYTSNVVHVTWEAGVHATFLSLNPSPLGATAGQTVTVAAALTDISANPIAALAGQTVTFTLGGASCNATTDANGIASCPIAIGSAGTSVLAAQFAGAANFLPSSDSSSFYTLGAAALANTTTALTATPNPLTAGHVLTLTATVSSAAPADLLRSAAAAAASPTAATGSVVFTDNGTSIGSVPINTSGQAALTTSNLAVGTHSMAATYSGDANDATSTSPAVAVIVVGATVVAVAAPTLGMAALVLLLCAIVIIALRYRYAAARQP